MKALRSSEVSETTTQTQRHMPEGFYFQEFSISSELNLTWPETGNRSSCLIGKRRPRTGHAGTEHEQRYSSTVSSTSALDGCGWLTPRPGRFTPRKETGYPLYRTLGGTQRRSGRLKKTRPTGIRSPAVQSVGIRHYPAPPYLSGNVSYPLVSIKCQG
jgi:hypothetical protein